MRRAVRLGLVDRDDPAMAVAAQCRLLKVARSALYHCNSQAPPRVSPIGNNGFLFSRPRLKLIACGAGT